MEPEDYRRATYETWEAMAPGWERRRDYIWETSRAVGEWMVRELDSRPGDTVLELGAGPGDTGFAATAALGDDGRLISTDFSPDMVEVARRRGAELGRRNVDYRVMDAERIELDSDSVDGVLCRFGYMLMADAAAALSETRRVLRPGGRLSLAVWGAPERNPWASIGGRMLVEGGHMPAPEPEAPGVFSMASEERTRALLERAGFTKVRSDEVPVSFAFRDLDDYVSFTMDTAGPFAIVVRGLSEDERETIKVQLGDAFDPFRADGGYELPGVALTAVAS
ncbi:MAG: class I SAM-dependent methyltransferase [Thermoleophilaceae bacterium]